jgi:hypothetical protein
MIRHPQFNLKAIFGLTLVVGVGCFAWREMRPKYWSIAVFTDGYTSGYAKTYIWGNGFALKITRRDGQWARITAETGFPLDEFED